MFIFSFFTASIFRMVLGIILSIVLLAVLSVAVVGALAVTGGPSACTPGDGPITVDAANSTSFQQKWDALNATLDSGAAGSTTFSESELSSRADTYLRKHDAGFNHPRVCVHNGSGEASATFSFLGFDMKVKVKGTVDLTGRHPKAKAQHVDVGNIPGFLTGPAQKVVNRAIDSALGDVDLHHRYTATLTAGQSDVSGTP